MYYPSPAFYLWSIFLLCLVISLMCRAMRQKTRNQPQRRLYAGSRTAQRQSLPHQEPTIYVSPSNLPPPPKYDFIAPPSYEEVVGIHYPNYQIQPISQPITTALAQGSSEPVHNYDAPPTTNDTAPRSNDAPPTTNDTARSNDTPTVVTIDERTTIPVTASS